jgi:hypothetical protein
MKPVHRTLESEVVTTLGKKHWDTVNKLRVSVKRMPNSLIEAFIYMSSNEINVLFASDIDTQSAPIFTTKDRFPMFFSRQDPVLRDLAAGVSLHEYGHVQYCPKDPSGYANILVGVNNALHDLQLNLDPHNIFNYFADILDNTMAITDDADGPRVKQGLDFFYLENGYCYPDQGYSRAFGFFVKLNMLLWQTDAAMNRLLDGYLPSDFFTGNDKPPRIKSEVLDDFKTVLLEFVRDCALVDKLMSETPLTDKERWEVYNQIHDDKAWEQKAYTFTMVFSKYDPDKLKPREVIAGGNSFSRGYNTDPGFKKRVLKKVVGRVKGGPLVQRPPGQPKKKQNPAEMGEPDDPQLLDDFCESGWDFTFLDQLYQGLAPQCIIENMEGDADEEKYRVRYLRRRPFTAGDPMKYIDVHHAFPDYNKDDFTFHVKQTPLYTSEKGTDSEKSVPDICFVVDSSASMDWSPGTKSGKYHVVLVGVFAILRYLEEKGLISQVDFCTVNFSSDTVVSGWKSHLQLDEIKRHLFNHQGGGTALHEDAIHKVEQARTAAVKGKENKLLVFVISDGEIADPGAAAARFKSMIEKGGKVFFFLVCAGKKQNDFFKAMRKVGATCKIIANAVDIDGIMLDAAVDTFSKSGDE